MYAWREKQKSTRHCLPVKLKSQGAEPLPLTTEFTGEVGQISFLEPSNWLLDFINSRIGIIHIINVFKTSSVMINFFSDWVEQKKM